ncbi:hypothetical protein PRNP1_002183 [Phytophthora ramorum]
MVVKEALAQESFTFKYIGLLWKWVNCSGDESDFDELVNDQKEADLSLLGPSIQYLSQYLDSDPSKDKLVVLLLLATKRIEWLKMNIEQMDKKFSWEMPDALFKANEEVQAFLRSSALSMITTGLVDCKTRRDAQSCATKWMHEKQHNCSFEANAGKENGVAFVSITKTRDLFLKQQNELVQYKTALHRVMDRFENTDGSDKKRCRLGSEVPQS